MDRIALELIDRHGLEPHPEGGHYRRIHASAIEVAHNGVRRPASTAIRFLLAGGERSAWHRVDADEAWHWQEGGTLELLQFDAVSGRLSRMRLGPPPDGEGLHCIVPAGTWQSACAAADPVLVVCTVSPGFVWEGFELLDPRSGTAAELQRIGVVKW